MKLEEYKQKLKTHNWYYEWSDDIEVWRYGAQAQRELVRIAKQSPDHNEAYHNAYEKANRNLV